MTPARREYQRLYKARRRQRWREAGLCVECGGTRKVPMLHCAMCLLDNLMRYERWLCKTRLATKRDPEAA